MRVLMVTTEFPTPERPEIGIFVQRQVEALRRSGVVVDVLAFRSAFNPLNHLRAWVRMRRMMRLASYDVIHAQFGHSAIIARLQLGTPVVMTFRGGDALGEVGKSGRYILKGAIWPLLSRAMSLVVHEVIAVSEGIRQRIPRRVVHVIPSGLDLELFRPRARDQARRALGWPLDGLVVLFAAMDVNFPNKRFDLARAAVGLAAQQLPGTQLRVATGVRPEEMVRYYNASDALLLTSVSEGSPNVVKEALACNLPAVTVDVGDVRKRLEGVTPSAVCEANAESLAEGLVSVLRQGRRCNGRDHVMALAEAALAKKVVGVYRKAVAQTTVLRCFRNIRTWRNER